MLQLECPNLHEHDQNRAIAFGHTWSPCYELSQSPPLHHGHAISIDMCFSMTWAAKEGWVSEALRDRVHSVFRYPPSPMPSPSPSLYTPYSSLFTPHFSFTLRTPYS